MATQVLTDAHILVNAVNLSTRGSVATLDYSAELQDDTAFGAGTRSRKGGLKDWSLTLELFGDEAAAMVQATLFPLVGSTTTVEVRPTSGARSATNPGYTGTAILESMTPVGGTVGEMQKVTATFRAAGTLNRAVA